MATKIPATVITGFLGAGKTTLIRHILQNAGNRKIALIINEFGDLGIDGDILKGCGDETCTEDDIVELSNGCICCTVADDFIPTVEKLLEREEKPDHIIIETSGLALPQPLVRAFSWPEISTRVTVDGVVTVVDGRAVVDGQFAQNIAAVDAQRRGDDMLDHETPLSELFDDQIACADMIVVNKSDLLSDDEAAALLGNLKADCRSGVQVLKAAMGVLPVDILLGQGVDAQDNMDARHEVHHHHHHDGEEGHHHHDHDHDDFESFVVTLGELTDPEAFQATLVDTIANHNILRLKGFAAVKGKPMRLTLQAVGPRIDSYFDRPFAANEDRQTRLVVIGQSGMNRKAIEKVIS